MRAASELDEDVGQDRPEQAVEDDRLRQREAEPLDPLQLTAQLRLARDGLDHRAEDVADADAGSERAETDAEGEADRLSGLRDVARGCSKNRVHRETSFYPLCRQSRQSLFW